MRDINPFGRCSRDRDNLLAACKPMLDGIADALGVNDSQFEPVTISREYGSNPGCVRMKISALAVHLQCSRVPEIVVMATSDNWT